MKMTKSFFMSITHSFLITAGTYIIADFTFSTIVTSFPFLGEASLYNDIINDNQN